MRIDIFNIIYYSLFLYLFFGSFFSLSFSLLDVDKKPAAFFEDEAAFFLLHKKTFDNGFVFLSSRDYISENGNLLMLQHKIKDICLFLGRCHERAANPIHLL